MLSIRKTLLYILCFFALIFCLDLICVAFNMSPFFCLPINYHDDGGTIEYYGLYYKIINYNIFEDDFTHHAYVLGTFALNYDSDYFSYEIIDNVEHCVEPKELILETDEYQYYLPCIKGNQVIIDYKNEPDITVKSALDHKSISIEDLMSQGLDVIKIKKET